MADSKRRKGKWKPPSREKYEKEHPTVSFRLDKETHQRLKKHLDGTKCSVADFVKDSLGREDSMIAARVDILAAKEMENADCRVRCLEDLVAQILLGLDTEDDPLCPLCGEHLALCEARAIECPDLGSMTIHGCPECGFFVDHYCRIDPDTIEWPQDEDSRPLSRQRRPYARSRTASSPL